LIDLEEWAAKATPAPKVQTMCGLGTDFTPDGEKVGLVSAIAAGEKFYLSVAPIVEFVRADLVTSISRAIAVNAEGGPLPVAVSLDPTGPGSTVVGPLQAAGVYPEE